MKQNYDQSGLINSEELARYIGSTISKVRDMRRRGEIPCLRLGNRTIRFDRAEVVAAIGRMRDTPKSITQAAAVTE